MARGAVLNRLGPRASADIDILHDREAAVATAADEDVKTLVIEGFDVEWLRREPGLYAAVVDPSKLDTYWPLAGQRGGHWPTSPEISGAMIVRTS